MEWTEREKKLLKWLKTQRLSLSHGLDHLEKVASYAEFLAKKYGGRKEVVIAAALVHDLARIEIDKRGKESAERGATLAKSALEKAGYLSDEVGSICRIISEHDQPEFHSKSMESRILKDADFLDGFGARGILRSVMYAGETHDGVEVALKRMGEKMRRRIEGLEFIESRRLGWKQYRLVEVFLVELGKGLTLSDETYSGKFMVIEGISGSGKDTQAKLLAKYLQNRGEDVVVINHPTEFLKNLWREWREQVDDRQSELFLMLADRVRMVKEQILPALKNGKIVISSRSQISSQVYQKSNWDSGFYRFCFAFEPVADAVVYLTISPQAALERADERVRKSSEKDRGFFGQKQQQQLTKYEEVLKFYPNVVRVDGSGTPQEVHEQVRDAVNQLIG